MVGANEARKLLEGAPGPLVAELDIFDPDTREAEASVHTDGVTVLFTAGTSRWFPNGAHAGDDVGRWREAQDCEEMRYARLFAASCDLAHTVVTLSEERDRLRAALATGGGAA